MLYLLALLAPSASAWTLGIHVIRDYEVERVPTLVDVHALHGFVDGRHFGEGQFAASLGDRLYYWNVAGDEMFFYDDIADFGGAVNLPPGATRAGNVAVYNQQVVVPLHTANGTELYGVQGNQATWLATLPSTLLTDTLHDLTVFDGELYFVRSPAAGILSTGDVYTLSGSTLTQSSTITMPVSHRGNAFQPVGSRLYFRTGDSLLAYLETTGNVNILTTPPVNPGMGEHEGDLYASITPVDLPNRQEHTIWRVREPVGGLGATIDPVVKVETARSVRPGHFRSRGGRLYFAAGGHLYATHAFVSTTSGTPPTALPLTAFAGKTEVLGLNQHGRHGVFAVRGVPTSSGVSSQFEPWVVDPRIASAANGPLVSATGSDEDITGVGIPGAHSFFFTANRDLYRYAETSVVFYDAVVMEILELEFDWPFHDEVFSGTWLLAPGHDPMLVGRDVFGPGQVSAEGRATLFEVDEATTALPETFGLMTVGFGNEWQEPLGSSVHVIGEPDTAALVHIEELSHLVADLGYEELQYAELTDLSLAFPVEEERVPRR